MKNNINDKWHYLDVDSEDVPNDDRDVVCYVRCNEDFVYKIDRYIHENGIGWMLNYEVLAWHEMPQIK